MISLARLMTILPSHFGICLELAYPTSTIEQVHALGHRLELNHFVDTILWTIYKTCTALGGPFSRRRITFTSFCPDACAAVNWKQPNYPVFFGSQCGEKSPFVPSPTALSIADVTDRRLFSLDAAVEFAKENNLLGVLLNAEALIQVPSLTDAIRDAGLIVCIYGTSEVSAVGDGNRFDAYLYEGSMIYNEQGL